MTTPAKPRVFVDSDVLFAGAASGAEHGASLVVLRMAEITLIEKDGRRHDVALEPLLCFRMKGIGYSHPTWGHGQWKGELAVGGESWKLAELDEMALENQHIQQVVRATSGGKQGVGVLEQIAFGPHHRGGRLDFEARVRRPRFLLEEGAQAAVGEAQDVVVAGAVEQLDGEQRVVAEIDDRGVAEEQFAEAVAGGADLVGNVDRGTDGRRLPVTGARPPHLDGAVHGDESADLGVGACRRGADRQDEGRRDPEKPARRAFRLSGACRACNRVRRVVGVVASRALSRQLALCRAFSPSGPPAAPLFARFHRIRPGLPDPALVGSLGVRRADDRVLLKPLHRG